MKRILAPLALALLATVGCGGTPAPTTTPAGAPTASEAATSPEVTPTPGFDTPAAFGDAVVFPSGVEVVIEAVSIEPPADDLTVVGEGHQAIFSLTINNKSGARIDASNMSWPKVSHGENLESATVITNAEITTLLDGDKKSDQFSRFIPEADAHRVRVQVPAPDGGQPATFEGSMPAT